MSGPGLITVGVPLGPASEVAVGVEQGAKYELIAADGTRAVLNDRTDLDFVGFLTAPPGGLDSPEVRESADLIVEGDGGVHGTFYFGRRPVILEGLIDPTADPARDYREVETAIATNYVGVPSVEDQANGILGTSSYAGAAIGGYSATSAARVTTDARQGTASVEHSVTTNTTPPATMEPSVQWGSTGAGLAGRPTVAELGGVGAALNLIGALKLVTMPTAATSARLTLNFRTAAGAYIGGVVAAIVTNPATGQWLDLAGSIVIPSTASGNPVLPEHVVDVSTSYVVPSPAASSTFVARHDAALITPTSGTVSYFDGETPGPAGFPLRSRWLGTPHLSRSVLYSVERVPLESGEVANRRINRLQRVTRALAGDTRLRWTAANGPTVEVALRRQQPLRIAGRLPKTFQAAMVAADPRILRAATTVAAGAVVTTETGSVNARGEGNAPAPAVVTVRAPAGGSVTGPINLRNLATGQAVRVDLNLSASQALVVDFRARTVTVDGANRYDAVNFAASNWWDLVPGDNPLRIVAAAITGAPTFEASWRDAWL